jgi:hypothetical protein
LGLSTLWQDIREEDYAGLEDKEHIGNKALQRRQRHVAFGNPNEDPDAFHDTMEF